MNFIHNSIIFLFSFPFSFSPSLSPSLSFCLCLPLPLFFLSFFHLISWSNYTGWSLILDPPVSLPSIGTARMYHHNPWPTLIPVLYYCNILICMAVSLYLMYVILLYPFDFLILNRIIKVILMSILFYLQILQVMQVFISGKLVVWCL